MIDLIGKWYLYKWYDENGDLSNPVNQLNIIRSVGQQHGDGSFIVLTERWFDDCRSGTSRLPIVSICISNTISDNRNNKNINIKVRPGDLIVKPNAWSDTIDILQQPTPCEAARWRKFLKDNDFKQID